MFFVFLISVRAGIKVTMKLKVTNLKHKFLVVNCRTNKVFEIVWMINIQPMRKLFCSTQPRNVS